MKAILQASLKEEVATARVEGGVEAVVEIVTMIALDLIDAVVLEKETEATASRMQVLEIMPILAALEIRCL